MKLTMIDMNWTDSGARVFFSTTTAFKVSCPRCGAEVVNNVEHLCGDRVPKPKKITKRKKAA